MQPRHSAVASLKRARLTALARIHGSPRATRRHSADRPLKPAVARPTYAPAQRLGPPYECTTPTPTRSVRRVRVEKTHPPVQIPGGPPPSRPLFSSRLPSPCLFCRATYFCGLLVCPNLVVFYFLFPPCLTALARGITRSSSHSFLSRIFRRSAERSAARVSGDLVVVRAPSRDAPHAHTDAAQIKSPRSATPRGLGNDHSLLTNNDTTRK